MMRSPVALSLVRSLRRLSSLVIAAVFVLAPMAIAARADEPKSAGTGPPGSAAPAAQEVAEAMVKFRDDVSAAAIETINDTIGGEVVAAVSGTHTLWVRARGHSDADLIRAYQALPEVEWAREAPNRMH